MKRITFFGLLTSGLMTLAGIYSELGCSEKDVPFIVDEDEIRRYLSEVAIAKELFRPTGLINPTPYTLPFDSAAIRDSVISRSRSMEVSLVPLKVLGPNGDSIANDPNRIYADHGYLGRVRESVVRVTDRFTIQVTKAYTNDTLLDTMDLDLTRYAFFLKLGDDTRDYVGWVLWGFNGIGYGASLGVTLKGSAGANFRGDLGLYPDVPLSTSDAIPKVPYIRLTAMDTVVQGSRLLVTTNKTSGGLPTLQLVSDYGEGGAFTRSMVRYDTINYIDSLSYQTPTTNPRLYNQLMIQMLTQASFPRRTAFVIPYRD